MNRLIGNWEGRAVIGVLAMATLAGCAGESPIGPDRRLAVPVTPAAAEASATMRDPDLSSCDSLQVPAGSQLAARLYATGDQIYRWNGTTWTFVAPSARLFADPAGTATVGTHYAGPTWESVSGSKVVGSVIRRCTPHASAIPWLLLGAVSSEAPGIFQGIAFIQRVNTSGGTAPSQPGNVTGDTASVPYTTEYLFYRAP